MLAATRWRQWKMPFGIQRLSGPTSEMPKGAKYFNSGVMLINLDYWRQNNVGERAIAFVRDNPTKSELL